MRSDTSWQLHAQPHRLPQMAARIDNAGVASPSATARRARPLRARRAPLCQCAAPAEATVAAEAVREAKEALFAACAREGRCERYLARHCFSGEYEHRAPRAASEENGASLWIASCAHADTSPVPTAPGARLPLCTLLGVALTRVYFDSCASLSQPRVCVRRGARRRGRGHRGARVGVRRAGRGRRGAPRPLAAALHHRT